MKKNYLKSAEANFLAQFLTFKTKLPPVSVRFGLTLDTHRSLENDYVYLKWMVDCQGLIQTWAEEWTARKNLARKGGPPPTTDLPLAPVLPAAPTVAVTPGIEPRYRALVQYLKHHPNYTVPIGQSLGIEGDEQTKPDLSTVQPDLPVGLNGGRVELGWGWQGLGNYVDCCEIEVDRGDGKGYVFLVQDTTPGYTDTQPLPSTPAKWTYRAIFRVGDDRVGLWSNPVSIVVGA